MVQEAAEANALKFVRERMQQELAHELFAGSVMNQALTLQVAIVLPSEAQLAVSKAAQPMIRDGPRDWG